MENVSARDAFALIGPTFSLELNIVIERASGRNLMRLLSVASETCVSVTRRRSLEKERWCSIECKYEAYFQAPLSSFT